MVFTLKGEAFVVNKLSAVLLTKHCINMLQLWTLVLTCFFLMLGNFFPLLFPPFEASHLWNQVDGSNQKVKENYPTPPKQKINLKIRKKTNKNWISNWTKPQRNKTFGFLFCSFLKFPTQLRFIPSIVSSARIRTRNLLVASPLP